MIICHSPQDASDWCAGERSSGNIIGYVATMGALHDGHLSLLKRAVGETDSCCASIFVNPLQFNNTEDFDKYPETFQDDLGMLDQAGCDMVFTGTLDQFFPGHQSMDSIPRLDPGPAAQDLEGAFRPGHLEGVVTIVDRLFRTVGECRTFFGEKDFQQTLVVRDLARRLTEENIHINVVTCPTIREASGLAMSSRNRRLSESGRSTAAVLFQALSMARAAWQAGERSVPKLEGVMQDTLAHPDITLEYATVRDADNWQAEVSDASVAMTHPRGLVAAYLEGIRLIDNLALDDLA